MGGVEGAVGHPVHLEREEASNIVVGASCKAPHLPCREPCWRAELGLQEALQEVLWEVLQEVLELELDLGLESRVEPWNALSPRQC